MEKNLTNYSEESRTESRVRDKVSIGLASTPYYNKGLILSRFPSNKKGEGRGWGIRG